MIDRLLQGVGVSPGVAVARAIIVRWSFPTLPNRTITPTEQDTEIARLHSAVAATVAQLVSLRERTLLRAGPEAAGIFDAQIMMVNDTEFLDGVESLIRKGNLSAETAYEFRALELRNAWQAS
ncbi:MAG: phosphoenolpyruvate-utilizing N-terminal domain-containing protein, partial [Gemmatimonadota bacterium]